MPYVDGLYSYVPVSTASRPRAMSSMGDRAAAALFLRSASLMQMRLKRSRMSAVATAKRCSLSHDLLSGGGSSPR